LLASCSHKYQTFEVIEKRSFLFGNEHNPVTPKLYPGRKEVAQWCQGQWFFSNNAVRDTLEYLNRVVRLTCNNKDYLLNSTVTETCWTALVYSRACIEIETFCPLK